MLGATYFGPSYFGGTYFGGAVVEADVVDVRRLTFSLDLGPRYLFPSLRGLMHTLPLGTDFLVHLPGVRVWDPISGTRIAATGLTITAHVALTPTGGAVDDSLSVELTERADGDYYGILQGGDLETHLRAHLAARVFLVFTVGDSDFLGHRGLRVVDGVRLAS